MRTNPRIFGYENPSPPYANDTVHVVGQNEIQVKMILTQTNSQLPSLF